ncbi:pilus assembly protein [Burkholderia diffusa]|uniref:Pilus assembly protein n=1 Tax=Burkholderia diffusa TaxID=488732 RepID=A0AAW3PJR8_9BURK|nr:molecular chaperone [Burkholderia diffusa]KUZ09170.1 pilus assembly protein [Burkholderia diffusa]KVC14997.1 pilus assembly protein [Burkholderia diffusa]KVH51138.1 pilus assembly protein [Burkholderia diffusa]KWF28665.1 pilus assembly protein [Burkholderia diffusa]KWF39950.1 pilus assembly protein [Burkholderia diffusa]
MKTRYFAAGVALACALITPATHAAISLAATRVIFDGKNKEASVVVNNDGAEALIQSWLDPLDDASSQALPFAVTPPLVKVPANRQQLLRVLYEGVGLPADRESAFWLNVQEIPQAAAGDNVLQLAVRQRIKVFFRPTGLKGDPQQAPGHLQWRLDRESGKAVLHVKNAGLYHVTVVDAKWHTGSTDASVIDAKMVAPGASASMPVKLPANEAAPELRYEIVNDFGGRESYRVTLPAGQSAAPVSVTH